MGDVLARGMAKAAINKKRFCKEELIRPFVEKAILTETDTDQNITGTARVSDPTSMIELQIGGSWRGWWEPFVATALGKSYVDGYVEAPLSGITNHAIATNGPHYLTSIDPAALAEINALTKWKLTANGLPMPIAEYQYQRDAHGIDFEATAFTRNEIGYIMANLQSELGASPLRYAIGLIYAGLSATHEITAGPDGDIHTVVATKVGWPHKFVFGAYPCAGGYLGELWVDPALNNFVDTAGSSLTEVAEVNIGFQTTSEINNRVCFAMSLQSPTVSNEVAKQNVIDGLIDAETEYANAVNYWETFWSDYDGQWDNISPEMRCKGLIAAIQVAARAYNGAVMAGPGQWYACWTRDACWAVRGMAKIAPNFCREVVNWFATTADSVNGSNSFRADGS